jgi:hypothetical protein
MPPSPLKVKGRFGRTYSVQFRPKNKPSDKIAWKRVETIQQSIQFHSGLFCGLFHPVDWGDIFLRKIVNSQLATRRLIPRQCSQTSKKIENYLYILLHLTTTVIPYVRVHALDFLDSVSVGGKWTFKVIMLLYWQWISVYPPISIRHHITAGFPWTFLYSSCRRWPVQQSGS